MCRREYPGRALPSRTAALPTGCHRRKTKQRGQPEHSPSCPSASLLPSHLHTCLVSGESYLRVVAQERNREDPKAIYDAVMLRHPTTPLTKCDRPVRKSDEPRRSASG